MPQFSGLLAHGSLLAQADLGLARLEEFFTADSFSCGLQRTDFLDLMATPLDELGDIDDVLERDVKRLLDERDSNSFSSHRTGELAPFVFPATATSVGASPLPMSSMLQPLPVKHEAAAVAGLPCAGPVVRPMYVTGYSREVLAAAAARGIVLPPTTPATPPPLVGPSVPCTINKRQCHLVVPVPKNPASDEPVAHHRLSTTTSSGSSSATLCAPPASQPVTDMVVSSGAERKPTATRRPKKTTPGSEGGKSKSVGPIASASNQAKKTKNPAEDSDSAGVITCQVCLKEVDKNSIRKYIRCRKVCNTCRLSSRVFRNGKEVRFCQLCSWFHPLDTFDGDRHSCKRALDRHNERRRNKTAATSKAVQKGL